VNVLKILLDKQNNEELKQYINKTHSYDLANDFFELTLEEQLSLVPYFNSEVLADIFSYNTDEASEILLHLNKEYRHEIINEFESDEIVDIINELDIEEKEELISELDKEDQEEIESLLEYKEELVGAHMTTSFIEVNKNDDVKVATKKLIDNAKETENISTIFVIDDKNKYVGTFSLNRLLKARSPLLCGDLIDNTTSTLDVEDISKAIDDMKNYALSIMPVVDQKNRLLGMLTFDDAIEIAREEASSDIKMFAGIGKKKKGSTIFYNTFKRLPWLATFLVLSVLISFVTNIFEEMLLLVPMLMIFEPLILDAAGDVGSQTLGMTLTLLQKKSKGLMKNSIKEILTSLINGFIEGLVAFGITFLFAYLTHFEGVGIFRVALTVGISLWVTVIIAPVFAIMIPIILKLFKVDPSIASGPFITTFIDIIALLIYFAFALLFVGGIL